MSDGDDPRALERVGSVLNEKWTLERLIGVGGMGAVYAGRHRNGARAAVKILHPDLARMQEVRERFLREGYAANSVEHRGVVKVLDDDVVKSGPDEATAYLVMELLEGESLDDRAEREKLRERDLLEVMDAVLDVLVAAHAKGVIHRDLKPENIFLARDPDREGVRVKVLDFGLARLTELTSVTSAGIPLGTPSFMSPEQASGRNDEVDHRTDIFALGATAFRLLAGRRIHEAENAVFLVALMATEPAPRLRSVAPGVSEPFARIVDRALAFERKDRYQDAASMRADVRAALELLKIGDSPTLHIVPFSARDVPEPLAKFGSDPPPNQVEVTMPRVEPEAVPEEVHAPEPPRYEPSESEAPVYERRRSSTLPLLVVAIGLGFIVWKWGPLIQAELERHASLGPWSTAEPSTAPPPPDPATADAGADLADAAAEPLAAKLDAGDDGGDDEEEEDDDDAGTVATDDRDDAGAGRTSSVVTRAKSTTNPGPGLAPPSPQVVNKPRPPAPHPKPHPKKPATRHKKHH